jgi:aspartokinase/homoserine dehydrogenase 1
MKNHTGISGRMFSALGRNGVNIRGIAQGSSERNISAIIGMQDVRKAVNVLHEAFFETEFKQIHLFLAGLGNVGNKLIAQLAGQQEVLKKELRLQVNLVGLANSRKMLVRESGIDPAQWQTALEQGEPSNIALFKEQIIGSNLRNSVFVDITAGADVAEVYDELLRKSVAVVACNKIAASSSYHHYRKLKDLSGEFNAPFLFETNVGAGLPVIGTLNDLMRSGDRIHSMKAVLSGTLNFVFNHYDGTRKFAEVVRQAQEEGYTEPDPRLDLSGKDVMRKILILAREAGAKLEMEEVGCIPFLPASCFEGSVDDFYGEMETQEAHFKSLYDAAAKNGCKLKFVATYENGKASVGLQHIPPGDDLYNLLGKDNIVLFFTDRYKDQPLVIKGAGAGAEVTAGGVFADILRSISK